MYILGYFFYFSNECTIFLANATCNSSMSFCRLYYCLTKFLGKKIDFSLEVHKTEISQMDLLSTLRQYVLKASLTRSVFTQSWFSYIRQINSLVMSWFPYFQIFYWYLNDFISISELLHYNVYFYISTFEVSIQQ